jgi:hypothetical protein
MFKRFILTRPLSTLLAQFFIVAALFFFIRPAHATDQISWSATPTPITLSDFEISALPAGRLISWHACDEPGIKAYQVQARRSGQGWQTVSPLLHVRGQGPAGADYAWRHPDGGAGVDYRLVEISRGGMVLTIDSTDPDMIKERAAKMELKMIGPPAAGGIAPSSAPPLAASLSAQATAVPDASAMGWRGGIAAAVGIVAAMALSILVFRRKARA